MRDQLSGNVERLIKRYGDEMNKTTSDEDRDEITEEVLEFFDDAVEDGRAPVEAYRAATELADNIIRERFESIASENVEKYEVPTRKSDEKRFASMESLAHSLLWLFTVAAYFLISMSLGYWNITWLMFISSSIGSIIITTVFDFNRGKTLADEWDNIQGILWLSIVMAYFLINFATGAWGSTWVIFIFGAAASVLLDYLKKNFIKK